MTIEGTLAASPNGKILNIMRFEKHGYVIAYALEETDGNDIIYFSRKAFRGVNNFRDSNQITFHRIRDFRKIVDNHIKMC